VQVFEGLRSLYLRRVKPLEEASWYSHFSTGATLEASDFDAKPMVLLLGQYSGAPSDPARLHGAPACQPSPACLRARVRQ